MTVTLDEPRSSSTGGSDFGPLARKVRSAGLLDRRRGYYAWAIGTNLAATVGVWTAIGVFSASWWVVLLAVPLALLTARTGFLGHDAGHRQIAASHRVNRWLGLLMGNLMLGMGYGWWNHKHNRHHANPNHVGKDPDVGEGILAWTQEQAARHNGRGARWFARHQAKLFFPLLLGEGVNLKVSTALDLRRLPMRDRLLEGSLVLVHLIAFFGLAFTLLSPGKAIVLILVQQGLFGVHLGSAFAPNHKGMEMPGDNVRWDHLRRQVLTSRNVRGGVVTDWMLGGLNYQIEHHLFPSVPRSNLRKLQPVVREYCAEVGLPYAEASLVASYRQSLGHLHDVADVLR